MLAPLLRRACRELTPALLTIDADPSRRQTYLVEAYTRRGQSWIRIDPLPGPVEPADHAVLDFRMAGDDHFLSGTLRGSDTEGAHLLVRRGPEIRPKRTRRLRAQQDTVVAIFVPENTGLGRCCQPVLDIGLRGLRIESSFPFEPGIVLRDLIVMHHHEVIRRAEGTVLTSTALFHPEGRISYLCSIRLRSPTRLPPDDDPADALEIRDFDRVCSVLWALCDLGHEVTLRSGTECVSAKLLPVRGLRSALPEMQCQAELDSRITAGTVVVECVLYASGYRFYARIGAQDGNKLTLLPAPVLREWHRREEERIPLGSSASATMSFRHPLGRHRQTRRLLDLSAHGLSVIGNPAEEVLWPGLPLQDVRIHLPDLELRPPEVIVRTVADGRCGLELGGLSERQSDWLRAELVHLGGKQVALHDGTDLDSILDFHRNINLLEPDMARNLDASMPETRKTWELAHKHPDGLVRTVVGPWKDGVGATANIVRAYDRGWVVQHTAVASAAVPATPGLMHATLFGLVIPRSDGEYVSSYANDEARSFHSLCNAFFNAWSTPEHRGATRFGLYAAETRDRPGSMTGLRQLRGADELLVEHAALRLLHPVCARSLGLRMGQVEIRQTRKAFALGGLERGRQAWGVFRHRRCVAILLHEWASPGLSLSSLLSSGMMLPVLPEQDRDGSARRQLAEWLLRLPLPVPLPVRFLFLPDSCDDGPLLQAGFRRVGGCVHYAWHRFGLREYYRYVAARYGFLQARLRAKVAVAA